MYDTILLLGRPGSGKGTQTKKLAESLGWESLSSGDSIKALRDGTGALSERVRATYDTGRLLPDWLPMYILQNTLINLPEGKGIVCEGFGRTKEQAKIVETVLTWLGRKFVVINLEVSEAEASRRMLERAKTEDRPDSNVQEKIDARFEEFRVNTEPGLAYFKELGVLKVVNGEQTPDEVARDVQAALG